ncbi:MAG: beta-propeller domain-containing protein [Archaeoglobaceae archaeon]
MKRGLVGLGVFFLIVSIYFAAFSQEKSVSGIKTFESPRDFEEYTKKSTYSAYYSPYYNFRSLTYETITPSISVPSTAKELEVERYSTTNVQVPDVDEPYIVKTDGKRIYLSYFSNPRPLRVFYPPVQKLAIVNAFPPEKIEKVAEIEDGGELFVYSGSVIVLNTLKNRISAYSVDNFEKIYEIKFNGSYVTSRMMDGKIYIITSKYYTRCPIEPYEVNGVRYRVECSNIYHPTRPLQVSTIYTIAKINAENGKIENTISFVASPDSVVYMSKNAIYVAYYSEKNYYEIMSDFIAKNSNLFPAWFIEKVRKLDSYDISDSAKSLELEILIGQHLNALSDEDRKLFETELYNRYSKYVRENLRQIQSTEIFKVGLDFKMQASARLPGKLLNQFSMDEYDGNLRVATTVGDENELFILDGNLKILGSTGVFGKDERIYAVRFLFDKAYVVTFKQIDPFFVVDLSDPSSPKIVGELKIPGYSSYLHPINKNLVLGVGKDGERVKISLFDVSNITPQEIDNYILQEYWSEVLSNHRAFLLDEKHKVFFLPASSGYVFSYKDNRLRLLKVAEQSYAAIYINDYLYTIGTKISVFEEHGWEKITEIDLT